LSLGFLKLFILYTRLVICLYFYFEIILYSKSRPHLVAFVYGHKSEGKQYKTIDDVTVVVTRDACSMRWWLQQVHNWDGEWNAYPDLSDMQNWICAQWRKLLQ